MVRINEVVHTVPFLARQSPALSPIDGNYFLDAHFGLYMLFYNTSKILCNLSRTCIPRVLSSSPFMLSRTSEFADESKALISQGDSERGRDGREVTQPDSKWQNAEQGVVIFSERRCVPGCTRHQVV